MRFDVQICKNARYPQTGKSKNESPPAKREVGPFFKKALTRRDVRNWDVNATQLAAKIPSNFNTVGDKAITEKSTLLNLLNREILRFKNRSAHYSNGRIIALNPKMTSKADPG